MRTMAIKHGLILGICGICSSHLVRWLENNVWPPHNAWRERIIVLLLIALCTVINLVLYKKHKRKSQKK